MKTKEKTCCIDCPHHKVIPDPDPYDWFCDDDCAVVCTLTKNKSKETQSSYLADMSEYRRITVSCRPYNIRKESETPSWCPLKKGGKK